MKYAIYFLFILVGIVLASAGVTWRDWQLYVVLLSMSVVGIVSKALP